MRNVNPKYWILTKLLTEGINVCDHVIVYRMRIQIREISMGEAIDYGQD